MVFAFLLVLTRLRCGSLMLRMTIISGADFHSPIPAAQYLRMSTDEQKLSLAYQASAIQRYAQKHGFAVVSTYEDRGRSGLTLKRRKGLTQLLQDAVSGLSTFKAVLVYDVSRWGRFQDADESAHYEFLCKSAGVPVHYCSEPFKNSTSAPAVVMKTLKRVMAAEYSRELSRRLTRSKVILVERGFRAGGSPGYGLRRMLFCPDGTPKRLLGHGEVKDIADGRVKLVPGPANEVNVVREIYRLWLSGNESANGIAARLNRRGIHHPVVEWDGSHIRTILTNPKYAGCATWRRTTGPLGVRSVRVPPDRWVVRLGAFDPLIDQKTYDDAQKVIRRKTCNRTNEDLLEGLRALLQRKGKISQKLIGESPDLPPAKIYCYRFGGLRKAYALIGYEEFHNVRLMKTSRRTMSRIRNTVLDQVSRIFGDQVEIIRERGGPRRALRFADGVKVAVSTCRYLDLGYGPRWSVPVNRFERDYPTLVCRCMPGNKTLKDIHLVRKIDSPCKCEFLTTERDPWLKKGKLVLKLSNLRRMINRMLAQSELDCPTSGGGSRSSES
jgi:DNA invertase Pin-like site-specific DNA recombinase